jgi:hypothetical protein
LVDIRVSSPEFRRAEDSRTHAAESPAKRKSSNILSRIGSLRDLVEAAGQAGYELSQPARQPGEGQIFLECTLAPRA